MDVSAQATRYCGYAWTYRQRRNERGFEHHHGLRSELQPIRRERQEYTRAMIGSEAVVVSSSSSFTFHLFKGWLRSKYALNLVTDKPYNFKQNDQPSNFPASRFLLGLEIFGPERSEKI